ncbi:hypothetical protein [Nocardioides bizhenqiangii]|uniref:Cobyrinic acid a,c-diamide synthase n=1 Tax=Nocardioides bizhenqiangii TaxID=3095076 RepID=A0ABZ0ZXP6_9ACTN|nr:MULTISPECIES: hypothetical protein [unclassified Nocardioides]MDZ5620091.1 hypothetical protein [Nocardioides sp. HM23]MDZ5623500.1 hypothetical protein [Nocardioides sp. HM23]WQQ28699.1 hypothetical protein SHK19_10830 [Nocardioides sp. HM61]
MSRRVTLPTADDLFRPTADTPDSPEARASEAPKKKAPVRAVPDAPEEQAAEKRPSGRIRHDEKMTVYVTSEELMEIEQVRLQLRGRLGLAVDRGRLVREAVSLVLADFEAHGEDSALVRRLRGE